MDKATGNTGHSPLDSLIGELINYGSDDVQSVIDILFTLDQKAIAAIPIRYRIIGLGFVRKLSLSEVNEKLVSNGCEKLYGRSIYEATLMHAFNNGLSYKEWKELFAESEKIRASIPVDENLSNKTVSLNDICSYVQENSDITDNTYKTQHITKQVNDSLSTIPSEKTALLDFMLKNIQSFSLSRECTRYYFCKYMMYFLETRRDHYLDALAYSNTEFSDAELVRQRLDAALDMLSVFRVSSKLTRKRLSVDEARIVINEAPVSLSEIYDAFQQFYFDYTSIDWMSVLLERYGDLDELSDKQKSALADSIRRYSPSVKKLSDDEVIEWQKNELEKHEKTADEKYSVSSAKTPAVSRTGEVFLRKVIRGDVDLDRTTFLSFLLFFDKGANVPDSQRINLERLREILVNCGFPALNDDYPFDAFFIDYIESDDPMVFLIEEAEIMAMSEENFYLYKTYLSSKDNDSELDSIVN